MAAIQLSGLASGLDWQSLITQLITAERTPETAWKAQQTSDANQITSLNTIQTNLTAFQTAAQALSDNTVFQARSANFSDSSSTWSATAAAGTQAGQHTFNVLTLATQSVQLGSVDSGAPLSSTSDVSGVTLSAMSISNPITAGTITVNGAQVNVATTDSLQDVFNNISTATGGAVTGSYDPTTDEITLSSSSPIVLGSSNDTSNFFAATNLFNNGSGSISSNASLGIVNLNSTIANSNLKLPITDVDSSGNGSFTINGVNIAFNVNTDSLSSILSRINASGAGVTASYNQFTDQFALTNSTTGNLGMSVSEASGGLLQAMGLNSTATFVAGSNATVQVDGGPTLTSTSNTFGASLTGITGLSVTADTTGTQTVNVANDTTNSTTLINNFISAYNTLQSYIDSQTLTTTDSSGNVTTSTLSGNHDVTDLATELRSIVFNPVSGLTGSVQQLADMGIDFSGTSSQLSITDQTALTNALQNDPQDVQSLFNGTGGLVSQINTFVNNATGTNGMIANETTSLTADSSNIDDQIAALERKITIDQAQLTAGFVAMEQAQSAAQSEAAALTAAFGGGSSSSSGSSSTGSVSISHATTS